MRETVQRIAAAVLAAAVLSTARLLTGDSALNAVLIGVAVLMILLLLLVFPDVANLDLRFRRSREPLLRRLLFGAIAPGLVIVLLGAALQSVGVALLGAALIAFFLLALTLRGHSPGTGR